MGRIRRELPEIFVSSRTSRREAEDLKQNSAQTASSNVVRGIYFIFPGF
jgi:hypothetical protein